MNLSEKTILITGASRGIGKAISLSLGKEWANLVLVGRNTHLLKALASELPGKHTIISADLTSLKDIRKIAKIVSKKNFKLDVLINNAGIGIYKPLQKVTEKDWETSYFINVRAPYFLTQALLPHIKKSSDSLVINIGSCSALQSQAERSLYNATKAAIRTTTLCLAEEYKDKSPDFVVITLDSTLTSFGPLSVEEKKKIQANGKYYLDPTWVSSQIVDIIKADSRDQEYVFSPDCYEGCGTWQKP